MFAAVPATAAEPMSIAIDKVRLMHLDADASVVMVANPVIADVTIESPRLLFVLGRSAGETNIYVLDSNGDEILHSPLVVVPKSGREIAVNRNVQEATLSCDPRCAGVPTPGATFKNQGSSGASTSSGTSSGATGTTSAGGGATGAAQGVAGVNNATATGTAKAANAAGTVSITTGRTP
ncbi:MAG: pilus assembly protein N-terminal domain-containing protein [Alphaproteobacteria bacterium]